MQSYCGSCGAKLRSGDVFCQDCGAQIYAAPPPLQSQQLRQQFLPQQQPQTDANPKADINMLLLSFKQMLKNPKQFLPMLGLGVFWFILSILPALGINSLPVKLISLLTFAQGGMYGGFLGAVGGVMGKAVFAYFVSALLLPLFSGRNPFHGAGGGFKAFFSGLAAQSARAAAPLLMGIGLGLVLYNFFTGNATPVNSMVGLVGFFLALKAITNKGGFIWGLLLTGVNKLSKGRTPSQEMVRHGVSGFGAGSALGMAFSALSRPYLPFTAYLAYMTGLVFIIIGFILFAATKSEKGAAV